MSGLQDIDAVILAGGLGTRLRAALPATPKFLAPIAGRPFATYLLERLGTAGVRRVILAAGHLHEAIKRFVGAWRKDGMRIDLSVEPSPVGTGGALRHALSMIQSDPVLVLNGDSLVDVDFSSFLAFHRSKNAAASVVAVPVPDVGRFGGLEIDGGERIVRFLEKGRSGEGTINAGVYLLNPDLIDAVPAGQVCSLEREVFPSLCGRGLFAFRGDFAFIDIGTPESLARAETFFEESWERS